MAALALGRRVSPVFLVSVCVCVGLYLFRHSVSDTCTCIYTLKHIHTHIHTHTCTHTHIHTYTRWHRDKGVRRKTSTSRVHFSDTRVGEVSVVKVALCNRSVSVPCTPWVCQRVCSPFLRGVCAHEARRRQVEQGRSGGNRHGSILSVPRPPGGGVRAG